MACKHRWHVARSIPHHVQDGSEFLARQLRRALQFDEMRREEAAVRVRLAERAGLDDARLLAHALDMLRQALRRGRA